MSDIILYIGQMEETENRPDPKKAPGTIPTKGIPDQVLQSLDGWAAHETTMKEGMKIQ